MLKAIVNVYYCMLKLHEAPVWGTALPHGVLHTHVKSFTVSSLNVIRHVVARFHHWMVSACHCWNLDAASVVSKNGMVINMLSSKDKIAATAKEIHLNV